MCTNAREDEQYDVGGGDKERDPQHPRSVLLAAMDVHVHRSSLRTTTSSFKTYPASIEYSARSNQRAISSPPIGNALRMAGWLLSQSHPLLGNDDGISRVLRVVANRGWQSQPAGVQVDPL